MAPKKIILFCEIDWNFLDQRHHHIARYFAKKGLEVVFVQRVISRIPSVIELARILYRHMAHQRKSPYIKPIPHGIKLKKSFFLPATNWFYNTWNLFYWKTFWRHRQKNSIVYSFVDNPFIIGNCVDSCVQGRVSVFDIIHNWWFYPWDTKKHKDNVENCICKYNKVVTDSTIIKHQLIENYNKSIHLMLPGISLEWIRSRKKSTSSKNNKVVFFGNLRNNSDVELVKYFSKSKLFELHIFGLIDKTISLDIGTYIYHPPSKARDVAKFCHNCAIILLPYKNDKFSETISPAKYFESLATGCLTVTRASLTHLPGWKDYVFQFANLDDIDKELSLVSKEQMHNSNAQINFAANNTWESRLSSLENFIKGTIN